MQKKCRKLVGLAVITGLGLLVGGCTYPVYKREITYKYDAEGKLIGTELRIGVTQMDPNSRPLRGDLGELRQDIRDLESWKD